MKQLMKNWENRQKWMQTQTKIKLPDQASIWIAARHSVQNYQSSCWPAYKVKMQLIRWCNWKIKCNFYDETLVKKIQKIKFIGLWLLLTDFTTYLTFLTTKVHDVDWQWQL